MLAYWLLYAIPAIPAFSLGTRQRGLVLPLWVLVGLIFTLAIGFRYQVGGDWSNYLFHYHHTIGKPLSRVAISDPGYAFLNWIMARWHLGIYGVNTVCGAVFIAGLLVYCRQLPAPWLGFAVAVPYLIIVMAMGYTRQSVALGFFFLALAAIERDKFLQYLIWVALGATFHKSAVLLVPLEFFFTERVGSGALSRYSRRRMAYGTCCWRSIRIASGENTSISRWSRRVRG